MAEFESIEKVSHLRIFTHNIKIRKFMNSCCEIDTQELRSQNPFNDRSPNSKGGRGMGYIA